MDRKKLEKVLNDASDCIDLLGEYSKKIAKDQADLFKRKPEPARKSEKQESKRRDILIGDLGDD
jgi:hypothetical protein